MAALLQTMASLPVRALQELSDTARMLCHAQSAGLSLLEDEDQRQNFHWRAISGEWALYADSRTPRNFSPCGIVLDRNVPLIFSHPERDFPYFGDFAPLLEEALLLPFYVNGEARGTIWVVFHDTSRRFDAEDLRVLTILGNLAGLTYQTALSLDASVKSGRELARSDAALDRFQAIVESSDDAIVTKDLNGVITSWNHGAQTLFGYAAEEVVGKNIAILIPADRLDEEPAILARIRGGERIDHYETKRARKDGMLLDISLTVSPLRDSTGRVIGASKIARDITDRKQADGRQSLLIAEMKHRIKNTLMTVQAIATQTLRETAPEERDAFLARLHSLSSAHDVLTRENWDRALLLELVNRTLIPFRTDHRDCFRIDGPEVWLNASKSTLLVMAIHELATNASKYGALSNTTGSVNVTWSISNEDSKATNLEWRETGGPTIVPPKRRGFGSRLIESALKAELGTPELEFPPAGVICRFTIPQ